MADRRDAVRTRVDAFREAVGTRSFWIVLPAAALVVFTVAWLTGSAAVDRAGEWRARTTELTATGETVESWRAGLVRPTPAESAAWERSRRAARRLGIEGRDRIALLEQVAQRAEELGLATVSAGFASADTLDIEVFREVDGRIYDPAPYALQLRVRAGVEGTGRLLGALPPQVVLHRLRTTRDEDGVLTELLLVVFVEEAS